MKLKKLAAFASAGLLVAALGLAGCASGEQESANEEPTFSTESTIAQVEIPVKVVNLTNGNESFYDGVVTTGEGSTALDVLQATELELDAQQGDYGMFVNAVNGLANEGMKGWVYTVNGEQVQTSADQTYLNDGDVVEWDYIDMSE